ncbi:MAG: GIY-YIG nuclease family protein, partial [Candidatus Omnitrophota bacterium]|nr:GIY-YIG nuclease family protein [Candidatus Omnitrophota bacterium]
MLKFKFIKKENPDKLPNTTGIYSFNRGADFLYIGKAINIKQRVKNHFNQPVFKDSIFLPQTNKIGFIETNSEIEALLLEAQLIKQHLPKYNSIWKDGKSHSFVYITKEDFPRVFIAHQKAKSIKQKANSKNNKPFALCPMPYASIGPFVDAGSLKQALRLLRKVFPFRTCRTLPKKPCLYKELNLCLAPCQLKVQ